MVFLDNWLLEELAGWLFVVCANCFMFAVVAVLPLVEGKLVNYIEKVFDPLIARSADGVLTVV